MGEGHVQVGVGVVCVLGFEGVVGFFEPFDLDGFDEVVAFAVLLLVEGVGMAVEEPDGDG